jgi:hypothetical protein
MIKVLCLIGKFPHKVYWEACGLNGPHANISIFIDHRDHSWKLFSLLYCRESFVHVVLFGDHYCEGQSWVKNEHGAAAREKTSFGPHSVAPLHSVSFVCS